MEQNDLAEKPAKLEAKQFENQPPISAEQFIVMIRNQLTAMHKLFNKLIEEAVCNKQELHDELQRIQDQQKTLQDELQEVHDLLQDEDSS